MKTNPLFAVFALVALSGCMSISGPNGERVMMVGTNVGFTTDQINEGNSDVGMIGSGLFKNDSLKTATLTPIEGPTGIHVGPAGISINTTIDQGTAVDEAGEWIYRALRAKYVLEGFQSLFDNYYGHESEKIAAEAMRDSEEIKAGVDIAEIEAGVNKAEIESVTDQAKILTEGGE